MEPSVRADGMALLICIAKVIDAILVVDAIPVVAVYEESSLGASAVVEVYNFPVPDVGTIIVGNRNTAVACANDTGPLRASAGSSTSSTWISSSTASGEEVQIIVEVVEWDVSTSVGPGLDRGQPDVLDVVSA